MRKGGRNTHWWGHLVDMLIALGGAGAVLVVLLLGPHHSMVVGTCCHLVSVLSCFLWLWVVVTVAGFSVMGAHHCCECLHSWAVVGHCGCACLWAVGGCSGQSSCLWAFVTIHVHGQLLVVVEGGCCMQLSLFVVVVHGGWSGVVIVAHCVCVDGGGKEKGSHITHCHIGITFELPHEITCK